jgi:ribosomal protein S18 acetylase RimI-like enzyme
MSGKRRGIHVRRAHEADLSALFALFDQEGELSDYAERTLESAELLAWVAEENGEIIGAILTHLMKTPEREQLGGVDELLVASTHRGRSVARRLMQAAEEQYRVDGAMGMQLTVSEGNEPAQRLYASMGYASMQRRMRMRKVF